MFERFQEGWRPCLPPSPPGKREDRHGKGLAGKLLAPGMAGWSVHRCRCRLPPSAANATPPRKSADFVSAAREATLQPDGTVVVPISYSCGPYDGPTYYKFTVTVTQGHGGFYATRGQVTEASYTNSIIVPTCDGLVHTVDISVPSTNGTFTTGAAFVHVLFTTVDNNHVATDGHSIRIV